MQEHESYMIFLLSKFITGDCMSNLDVLCPNGKKKTCIKMMFLSLKHGKRLQIRFRKGRHEGEDEEIYKVAIH